MARFFSKTRERYMAVSEASTRVITPEGTGHNFWKERNLEVDFVVERGKKLLAIEVKSGRSSGRLAGMGAFSRQFPSARKLLVGGDGMDFELFLSRPVIEWFED